jgi:hypothetical protein
VDVATSVAMKAAAMTKVERRNPSGYKLTA